MASSYHEIYQSWQNDPEAFWAEAARDIDWIKPPQTILDSNAGVYGRWFPDATCNTCYNALDRHADGGRGAQTALIYDSPITGAKATWTFAELRDEVSTLAAVLRDLGVEKGDRVIVYMPMIAEAVMAMLACARIGAIHSVVFGGFAAKELATRIDDAKPKVIMAASCGIEPGRIVAYKPLLDAAIGLSASKPQSVLMLQREQAHADMHAPRDHDWAQAVAAAKAAGKSAECVELAATDPLYILYTSGTTGIPKGVVRDNGGHMVALKWTMKNLYGIDPGETFWAASDVGWVVGHSYIVYAPLLHGSATICFEGKPIGTPDAGVFWRIIEEHKVAALFTAPTAFRAIRKEDPEAALLQKYDLSHFRTLFLAGERADPDTIKWAEEKLGVPVIDHWWQTETLWQNDARMRESYLDEFPGYYKTADAGYKDNDGYLYIMGRTDDIINVAGHRLSTGGMEEVLASHPDVAECAVIGAADNLKGEVPLGFLVLKSGVTRDTADIEKEVVGLVREKIGPVASFRKAVTINRLPKTRSGKILRGTIKKIADREDWAMPATIDDPVILDEITAALKQHGLL